MKTKLLLMLLGIATAAAGLRATPVNSLFNPADYPAVDTNLVLTGGTVAIDTRDGTNAPTWTYGTTNYTGQIVTNQSGKVVMALFNFGGLAISNAVSITVTGNLGLVLSSTGDLTMASTLDLSGRGSSTTNGPGGPGAENGVRLSSTNSAPPGMTRGNGGYKGPGIGFGAGGNATYPGAGGGYGGVGGNGGKNTFGQQAGGSTYGDALLTDLFGGSGGSTGNGALNTGGGGGGSLELIANRTLTIAATAIQKVSGGTAATVATDYSAGGGSGGGIVLAANRIEAYGALQAKGGDGKGNATTAGGGGGGGRIAFYANALVTNAGLSVSVAGGAKGGSSTNGSGGAAGTFRYLGDGQGGDLSFPYTHDLPNIAGMAAVNVLPRTASLPANLLSTGGDPGTVVSCYWGTNSAAWDFSANLGTFAASAFVTNPVTGLTPGTTYFFAFAASNAVGAVFTATNSFTTPTSWPTISSVGVSNVTAAAATVYGYLSNTGESVTVVYLLYGTTPGAWTAWPATTATNADGQAVPGPVIAALNGLTQNQVYYCQYAASNNAGWGYAPVTNTFTTLPLLGLAAKQNSLFNPRRYATLADSLTVSSGTIAIDTGDGVVRGPSLTANGTTYRGQVVPNQSGNVWLALFNFGDLAISAGVSCTVTGNLGLVLASTHDLTMDATLDLGGSGIGQGGPGAEGGTRGVSTNSAPAGGNRGNGGYNNNGGIGFGGGFVTNATWAGGGGYGGVGGTGCNFYGSPTNAPGGTNYGDSVLSDLFGGSGGGAGAQASSTTPTGGGGGGALELVANGTLTISATSTQRVNGGNAVGAGYRSTGAGSGGGILLAASHLVVAGALQARGGTGSGTYNFPTDTHNDNNTGGGGGRIALYALSLTTNGMTYSVAGGAQGGAPTATGAGAIGTFRYMGDDASDLLRFPYYQKGIAVFFR